MKLSMIWLMVNCFRRAGLFLAMGALFCAALHAGEPIVFGNAKTKIEPDKEKAPIQTPFKLEKLASPAPFDFNGVTPPILPRLDSNPRKDKHQQNVEDEKRNWMFLREGELDSEDAEKNFLGIRDDEDGGDLDKTKGPRDYMFKDKFSSKSPGSPGQSRMAGPHRKPDAKQPPPNQNREEDTDDKRQSTSSAIIFGNSDRQVGGRSGGELDLQSMLGSKASDRIADQPIFSLGNGSSGSDLQANRDRQARVESFKQLLNGPSSLGGLSDPVNLRSDFTHQPLNPVTPSLGNSLPQSFGNSYFTPRPSPAAPNSSLNYLSPDSSSRFSSGLATPPPAPGGWKPTEVQWPRSRF